MYDYVAFPTLTDTFTNDYGHVIHAPILARCPSDNYCGGEWQDAVANLSDGMLLRCGHVYGDE